MEVWLYGVLFVGLVVAVSAGGMLLTYRFTSFEFLEGHNEVASFIYAVVGVIYAVLLSFVISFTWEQHREAETLVEQEANELGDLFRDTAAFQTPGRQELQASVRAYVQAVRRSEWR